MTKTTFMPSFDIVSKADIQKLDNAINTVKKELLTRYDFRDTDTEVSLDKKNNLVTISTSHSMGTGGIVDIIISRGMKQGLDPRCFDFSKEEYVSGKLIKKDVPVKNGIERETAKSIVKIIKDTGLKVQASIMDDSIRVTGKKIDDLQQVMQILRTEKNIEIPLQFDNMKS